MASICVMHVTCGHTCHPWSHLSPLVTLVTLGHTCHLCHMYSCPNIQISAYTILVTFRKEVTILILIHFVWDATFTEKALFLGRLISQEVAFHGRSYILGIHIPWEFIFPRKANLP